MTYEGNFTSPVKINEDFVGQAVTQQQQNVSFSNNDGGRKCPTGSIQKRTLDGRSENLPNACGNMNPQMFGAPTLTSNAREHPTITQGFEDSRELFQLSPSSFFSSSLPLPSPSPSPSQQKVSNSAPTTLLPSMPLSKSPRICSPPPIGYEAKQHSMKQRRGGSAFAPTSYRQRVQVQSQNQTFNNHELGSDYHKSSYSTYQYATKDMKQEPSTIDFNTSNNDFNMHRAKADRSPPASQTLFEQQALELEQLKQQVKYLQSQQKGSVSPPFGGQQLQKMYEQQALQFESLKQQVELLKRHSQQNGDMTMKSQSQQYQNAVLFPQAVGLSQKEVVLPESFFQGVTRLDNGRWQARVCNDTSKEKMKENNEIIIGTFDSETEAAKAFDEYLVREGRNPQNIITLCRMKEMPSLSFPVTWEQESYLYRYWLNMARRKNPACYITLSNRALSVTWKGIDDEEGDIAKSFKAWGKPPQIKLVQSEPDLWIKRWACYIRRVTEKILVDDLGDMSAPLLRSEIMRDSKRSAILAAMEKKASIVVCYGKFGHVKLVGSAKKLSKKCSELRDLFFEWGKKFHGMKVNTLNLDRANIKKENANRNRSNRPRSKRDLKRSNVISLADRQVANFHGGDLDNLNVWTTAPSEQIRRQFRSIPVERKHYMGNEATGF
eukprot:g796.t1